MHPHFPSRRTLTTTATLGLALAVASPLLEAQTPATPAPDTPTAAQVIERHLAAVGGSTVLNSTTCLVMKGTGREREAEIQFTLTAAPPGRCLLAGEVGAIRVRTGCDADGVFWRQDPGGVRELTAAESRADVVEMLFSLNPFALAHWHELGFTLEPAGRRDLEGRPVFTLTARHPQGAAVPLCFDDASGLLVAVGDSRLSDYREVAGWKLPHRLRSGGALEITFTDVRRNEPLAPGTFAKPSGPTAEPAHRYETRLSPDTTLTIVRRPAVANFNFGPLRELPRFQPDSTQPFQVDLRSRDVSTLDLRDRAADLRQADFDDQTRWPAVLPAGFEPGKLMDLGRNPGLRVRQLHRRGITGKGIGIGIIDQPLLVDHVEYRDRVRLYEEIHILAAEAQAAMHGAAVTSIAAGQSVGVAPEAELYFIAEMHGEIKAGRFEWDFKPLAQSIERLLDLNRQLPPARRIRVISISVGWSPGQAGCTEADAAVERATREGVFVISTALERTHRLAFHGLGRLPEADPDDFNSYGLGSWWAKSFLDGQRRFAPGVRLLVPMDARSTASPTGVQDYVHYAGGGWSWSVPYLAGLYALACQVKEDITPQRFWAAALQTGRTVKLAPPHDSLELGTLADPVALIEALEKP
ncbi:MAG: hypothetical protein HS113_11285 [Verrucomicrobiales bacterium]|nr:hypothetical protein [Verrucomicrobiales bacterium]